MSAELKSQGASVCQGYIAVGVCLYPMTLASVPNAADAKLMGHSIERCIEIGALFIDAMQSGASEAEVDHVWEAAHARTDSSHNMR
jgi:hypothetical protein